MDEIEEDLPESLLSSDSIKTVYEEEIADEELEIEDLDDEESPEEIVLEPEIEAEEIKAKKKMFKPSETEPQLLQLTGGKFGYVCWNDNSYFVYSHSVEVNCFLLGTFQYYLHFILFFPIQKIINYIMTHTK